jgi:hypothetical protein
MLDALKLRLKWPSTSSFGAEEQSKVDRFKAPADLQDVIDGGF